MCIATRVASHCLVGFSGARLKLLPAATLFAPARQRLTRATPHDFDNPKNSAAPTIFNPLYFRKGMRSSEQGKFI